MGERRALVIGVRNDRFGVLDFVDDVVTELHTALLDSERGACLPALPGGRDLLIGDMATSSGIDSALADAISAAAIDQATLFVYFLGHAQQANQDFYLIGTDTGEQVDSRTAVQIGQRVKELLDNAPTVDGLMLVLDACHSGAAITDPVPGLMRTGVHVRLEIFAATRDDQTASRGCFTRSIVALLTHGSPASADEYLTAYNEHSRLREVAPPECADMPEAVHLSIRGGLDAGLWLGRNRAVDLRSALLGTQDAAQVAQLTQSLVHTSYLTQLMQVQLSGRSPIAITGAPGIGKSVLLAALGRARVAGDFGVDALVAVRPGDTLVSVATRLAEQLRKSDTYQKAASRWSAMTPVAIKESTSVFDAAVSGPISFLDRRNRLLVGVDGVDQLGTIDRRRLLDAFTDTPGATLIVTGRAVPDIDTGATVELPETDQDSVGELLEQLVDDVHARSRIAAASAGEWLLARILAGLWRAGHFESLPADAGLDDVFSEAIAVARVNTPEAPLDDALTVLAAAPPGAWMPLSLFTAVLAVRSSRTDQVQVRDILVALGELVSRADPGTNLERVGPAHDLIAAYLAAMIGPEQLAEVHGRVADAIREAESDTPTPELISYARQRKSDHLWRAGRHTEALEALPELDTPADNLSLWQLWRQRSLELGSDDPAVLTARQAIAIWARLAGDLDLALEESAALLADQTRLLGPDHESVLETRLLIATVTGDAGDARAALKQITELWPDVARLLAPDDSLTLLTRVNIATVMMQAGDTDGALQRLTEVVPEMVRALGDDHRLTLSARVNLAAATGRAGDTHGALEQFTSLVPDLTRALGPDDLLTIAAQNNQALMTLETGDPSGALALYKKLLTARDRMLGPDHRSTLITRAGIARSLAEMGNITEALEAYNALLEDEKRALGPDHPETLTTRHNIAMVTELAGDMERAGELLTKVYSDRVRVLGPDHPDTLITRQNLDANLDEQQAKSLIQGSSKAKERDRSPRKSKNTRKHSRAKGTRRPRRRR
jgi:tetratricopeptide (TPR) repeat protein